MLGRAQVLSILFFIMLFLLLYFGCGTKTKSHKAVEKSRSFNSEAINIQKLIAETKDTLMLEEKTSIDFLNGELAGASDSLKIRYLEKLSSEWYTLGQPIIAGYYAEQIALKNENENAWSITGTTFAIGLKSAKTKEQREYAFSKSTKAFENAMSINPNNIDHTINLALCYTENPPEDNPMKGVLMMVDLNKKNPNNIKVLFQLAKLSLKTNQIEKAINRCEQIIAIDPMHKDAHCMLAQILTSSNRAEEAKDHVAMCK